MDITALKAAIEANTSAFEAALESQQPHAVLRQLYLELKELKYQLVQAELQKSVVETTEQ